MLVGMLGATATAQFAQLNRASQTAAAEAASISNNDKITIKNCFPGEVRVIYKQKFTECLASDTPDTMNNCIIAKARSTQCFYYVKGNQNLIPEWSANSRNERCTLGNVTYESENSRGVFTGGEWKKYQNNYCSFGNVSCTPPSSNSKDILEARCERAKQDNDCADINATECRLLVKDNSGASTVCEFTNIPDYNKEGRYTGDGKEPVSRISSRTAGTCGDFLRPPAPVVPPAQLVCKDHANNGEGVCTNPNSRTPQGSYVRETYLGDTQADNGTQAENIQPKPAQSPASPDPAAPANPNQPPPKLNGDGERKSIAEGATGGACTPDVPCMKRNKQSGACTLLDGYSLIGKDCIKIGAGPGGDFGKGNYSGFLGGESGGLMNGIIQGAGIYAIGSMVSGLFSGNKNANSGYGYSPYPSASSCGNQPSQPDSSSCTGGAWRATYSGSCISGWQCVPGAASATVAAKTTPTASIACAPSVADVGAPVTVSYSCSSGTAVGGGFSAASSSPVTVAAPNPLAGSNTATFGLTCTDSGLTGTAQCSVQVARVSLIFVANPAAIVAGDKSTLGWVTSGMSSCVVSSPDLPSFTASNASNTAVNGTVITPALATSTTFAIQCATLGGNTRSATALVTVR